MELTQHGPQDPALPAILDLMRKTFAYMDGVIDPPSSIHRMTLSDLHSNVEVVEVWSAGSPPVAAVILTPKSEALYVGKLCVAEHMRGRGVSRQLIDHAADRARSLGKPRLELETRIELTANHAAFRAMGFVEVERTAHEGFQNSTAITFAKEV